MSARDDYPPIPNGARVPGGWGALHLRMCAEIDRLRSVKQSDDGAYEHVVELWHESSTLADKLSLSLAELDDLKYHLDEVAAIHRRLTDTYFGVQATT